MVQPLMVQRALVQRALVQRALVQRKRLEVRVMAVQRAVRQAPPGTRTWQHRDEEARQHRDEEAQPARQPLLQARGRLDGQAYWRPWSRLVAAQRASPVRRRRRPWADTAACPVV
jgi:hypothetical protein